MLPFVRHSALKKAAGFGLLTLLCAVTAPFNGFAGIDDPIHGYWTKKPQDRFSRFHAEWKAGRRQLDTSGEIPFLKSLLQELDVPVSSQMLVYSVTSLQKNLISPRRPRALYFNDDTYVGYVPGGRVEVISLDPDLGGIFYIFDRFRPGQMAQAERTDECMTCHAPRHLQEIPGLVIESVVPGITGGGEKAFRRERSGHDIPFSERFGGWHVTGAQGFPRHWGNLLLEYTPEGRRERPIQPGDLFDLTLYPLPTSDLLPQLLHEHQVGFVNRALQATYRTRSLLQEKGAKPDAVSDELDQLSLGLVKYLLFADEVPLPVGVTGSAEFKQGFAAGVRRSASGVSLRDLDLSNRLLRYRCSYMIYSPAFTGLPMELKKRVMQQLYTALEDTSPQSPFGYLPPDEKRTILGILRETLPEFAQQSGAGRS